MSQKGTMSQNASDTKTFDRDLEDKGQLRDVSRASVICLLPVVGNAAFQVSSVMLYLIQKNLLFGDQVHEDSSINMKNYINICSPF